MFNFLKEIFYENGQKTIIFKFIIAISVFLIAKFIHYIIKKIIERIIIVNERNDSKRLNKVHSVVSIISSILKYLIYFFAIIIILGTFGINTSSLIATAGIGGLVVAFGVQSVIKDLFGGVFILLEDQYNVGDNVKINGIEGEILAIHIRNTVIKGYDGSVNIISNGDISSITNYSKGLQRSLVNFYFSNNVDVDKVKDIIKNTSEKFKKNNTSVKVAPKYFGITELGPYYVKLTVELWSLKSTQWTNEKNYREEIFLELRKRNIKFIDFKEIKGDDVV